MFSVWKENENQGWACSHLILRRLAKTSKEPRNLVLMDTEQTDVPLCVHFKALFVYFSDIHMIFSVSCPILAWENSLHCSVFNSRKWHLRNVRRNSILMVCHYPDLVDVISMEFLLSFLRHRFVAKPLVVLWNDSCFFFSGYVVQFD